MLRLLPIILALLLATPAWGATGHCRIRVDDGGGMSSIGSGTLIAKNGDTGLVLTCAHLFDDSQRGIVVEFTDGKRYRGNLIERNRSADLSAVLIKSPAADPIPAGKSANGKLQLSGFGQSGRLRSAWGRITGWYSDERTASISTPAYHGDSGGTVQNEAGEFVGVIWGGDHQGQAFVTMGDPLDAFLTKCCPGGSCYTRPVYPSQPPDDRIEPPPTRPPVVTQPPVTQPPPDTTDPTGPNWGSREEWHTWSERFEGRIVALENRECKDGLDGRDGIDGKDGESPDVTEWSQQIAAGVLVAVRNEFNTRITNIEAAQADPDYEDWTLEILQRLPPIRIELTRPDGTIETQDRRLGGAKPLQINLNAVGVRAP